MINRMLDLAIKIQQIPAPSFDETGRSKFLQKTFADEALADVHIDSVGNVLGCLRGAGQSAPVIISAHMDTVFPIDTNLMVSRGTGRVYGPGIGDNSVGVAGLLGLLWRLREQNTKLPGDIWFVANTCEEGLGDLRGMKAIVETFGAAPKVYLILEGMALGHVYHRAVGVRRYKIIIHTQGGHSWIDFGKPSAIHKISALVANISDMKMPIRPHSTFNIGRIGGGTSINTIAAEAWLELDLRSEGQSTLLDLTRQVENLVGKAKQQGVDVDMQLIGQRPAGEISSEHPIIRLAQACLYEQGLEPVLTIGSTDANIPLSKGYPALVLGLTRGGGAHTINEFIETAPLEKGLEHLVQFVNRVWY